ncbi:hypothetical protein [Amycolatopsis sp. YIM 10]|uniref:hypothetical protein n=1 Tax=Amycolatopsis sp. YIM 10 TaxID=2653857 RepID=UPI0012902BA0|nr:hypothetical protein [Amycolatopsis sp. YIM 10]
MGSRRAADGGALVRLKLAARARRAHPYRHTELPLRFARRPGGAPAERAGGAR